MTGPPRRREHGRTGASHPHPEDGAPWEDEVRHHLRRGFVLLGVGSRVRGDDAAGSVVAERLAARGVRNAFDCGGVPENYAGLVEKLQPQDVLFVDAVDFGKPPGSIALFGGESFQAQSVSTHSAGLSPLIHFLAATSKAVCWVLAIQPADLTYGADLSAPVRGAVGQIVSSDVWLGLSD